jgi:hypothetical protein
MQTAAAAQPLVPTANQTRSIQRHCDQKNFGQVYRLLTNTETLASMTQDWVVACEALYLPKTTFLPYERCLSVDPSPDLTPQLSLDPSAVLTATRPLNRGTGCGPLCDSIDLLCDLALHYKGDDPKQCVAHHYLATLTVVLNSVLTNRATPNIVPPSSSNRLLPCLRILLT